MMIKGFLYNLLEKRKDYPNDELYRYALLLGVAIIALIAFTLFTIYFFVAQCTPLGVSYMIGVLVFVAVVVLLQLRLYDTAAIIIALTILLCSLITIWCIGGKNFSLLYQLIVLLLMMVVPFDKKAIPYTFRIAIPILMVVSFVMDISHTPPYDIGIFNDALAVINIIISCIGVIMLIWLEKFVRSFVNAFYEKRMKELQDQAHRDSLTQLYNRRYADLYFGDANRRQDQSGYFLALIDIDDFKTVNDTYGHDVGDYVLQTLSATLTSNTRKTDVVFRWGGEEFLLLINDTDEDGAFGLLEKIRLLVANTPLSYNDAKFKITITIGMAELEDNIQECLKKCDQKMYYGKRNGKNMVVR